MPKRSEDNLEPEPTPTRRSSRRSIAPSRVEEEPSAKKTSRKKKTDESESDTVLTTIEEHSVAVDPVTPKKGRRKSTKAEDLLMDDEDDLSVQPEQPEQPDVQSTTEEKKAPSTPQPTPTKATDKIITPKKVTTPLKKAVSPVKTNVVDSVPQSQTPVTYSSSSVCEQECDKDSLQDGDEIVAIWTQCQRALSFGWSAICPVFAATIFVLTLFGVFSASQFVAIVGIVYVLFFGLILGSYALCMIPFILVSRLFTQIVCANNIFSEGSTRYINLCCRLLLFVTTFALAGALVVAAAKP